MQALLFATMALPEIQAGIVGVGDGIGVNVGTGVCVNVGTGVCVNVEMGVDDAIGVVNGFGVRVGPNPGMINTPS